MSKKKPIEEIKALLKEGGVDLISKEYKSANIPIEFKCVCGNIGNISIISAKRALKTVGNIRCKRCRGEGLRDKKNFHTRKVILDKFKGVNIVNIIPGVHEKSPPKIEYECPICGGEDSINYKHSLNILICKKCSNELKADRQRLKHNEVRELFEEHGATLLSEYKYTNQRLAYLCKCGNIGYTMLTNIKYKSIIPLCKECQLKYSYPKGEVSPNWNSSLTDEDRNNWGRNNEDKQWYRRIFEKFNYTCFITGERNIALAAHHLFQYAKYPELRLDINNGVCISRELHYEFHKRYSYRMFNIEDFGEFFYDKTGVDFSEYYNIVDRKWLREDKMKIFTLEEAREFVRKCGAEPLFEQYTNSYNDYLVRCFCGREEKIKFSTLGRNIKKNPEYEYRCSKCRNVGRPIYITERIKEDFKQYGAEPLFDNYENLKQKLSYKCGCGKIDFTTCSQFYRHIKEYEDYRLLCQSCSCREARKDKVNDFFNIVVIPYFKKRSIKLLSNSYVNNHTHLRFLCECGKEGRVTWGSIKNNNCLKCKDCQLRDRPRGENHPDWNSLLSDEDRLKTRYGRGNLEKIWESLVLKLANYICIVSGQKGGELSAHHLNAWAKNSEQRYRLNNGVCISRKNHKEFHDKYGMKKGNNTIEQFREFYKEKTGGEFKENNVIVDFIEGTPYLSYLLNRKKELSAEGKSYIPFFIPEIMMKQDIVLSMIRYRYGIIKDKIYARKLKIEEIKDFSKVRKFLDENHIQGYAMSGINLALVNEGQIISLMTFMKNKIEGEYLLQRFCSRINTVVVGGASKLFKYFIKEYDPEKVVTYGDVRFSDIHLINSMYIILGFKYSHTSKPNYWYTKDGLGLQFRRKFQRHKLDKIFNKEYDKSLSERDIMLSEGYQRLYDCGNDVFVYRKNWSFFV